MRFTPGQSGNPAGRPLGSRNRKTLACEALFEAEAEEAVRNVIDRAKDGQPAAMRLCMERAVPTGRNRPLAIALPPIKRPEDAEAAVEVVTAELGAGNLTIQEASSLISLIDRTLQLAERIWKMKKIRAVLDDEPAPRSGEEDAARQQPAPDRASPHRDTAEGNGAAAAPLYSPVNQADAGTVEDPGARTAGPPAPAVRHAPPDAMAA
jgi:Family of unknown function (DUF5681)